MFGITDILAIIKGVLQFPGTILEFIKLLQKTPEEKHDDLMKQIQVEAKKFQETGRPTWD